MFWQIIKKSLSIFGKDNKESIEQSERLIQNAIEKHIAGNLQEAEVIYRAILEVQPNEPDALHLLGLVAHQVGNNKTAINLLEKAISVNPNASDFYFHCAEAYLALHKNDLAITRYKQALAIKPDYVDVLNNLGLALHKLKRYEETITHYEQAIVLKPDYAEAHNNLANSLQELDRQQEAITHYEQAIVLKPDYAEAHYNLGNTLQKLDRQQEAIIHYEQAIVLKPDYAEAHYNLGNTLQKLDRQQEAIIHYEQAIVLKPDYAEAHNNLGYTLQEIDQLIEAVKHYEQAIVLKPDYAEAHYNLGFAYLLNGSFEKGWLNYEWRYKTAENKRHIRNFNQPQWDGSPLNHQTIFLHAEQGLGDTIQFIRYLPMVANSGGNIIVECDQGIIHLFSEYKNIADFIGKGEPIPDFDVHSPLLSLPKIFNTTYDTIPSTVNYIHANETLINSWNKKLSSTKKYKVGFFWQGNKKYFRDKSRSIPLIKFKDLLSISGVEFISLQKGEGQEQIIESGFSHLVSDYTSQMDNVEKFADTVAIINGLDLIIGTDTSIIHLAGAMGKPVWLLLPFYPDWRWMLNKENSPWYPTMRLFRQQEIGDWGTVINQLKDELQKLVT
jgi:tetratricopeptide (TPR) repeat protein